MTVLEIIIIVFWSIIYLVWSWFMVAELVNNRRNKVQWYHETDIVSFWKVSIGIIILTLTLMALQGY